MIKQCKGLYHPVPSRVFYLFLLSISYMKVYQSYKPFGSTEIQSIKNTSNQKLRCVEKPQIFCSFSHHLSEKKKAFATILRDLKNLGLRLIPKFLINCLLYHFLCKRPFFGCLNHFVPKRPQTSRKGFGAGSIYTSGHLGPGGWINIWERVQDRWSIITTTPDGK